MQTPIFDVAKLMPHSGNMMLLDTILSYSEDCLSASILVSEQHVFVENKTLASWTALEFMAQAVAAWSGCCGQDNDEAVRLGFLLGTRKLALYFDALSVPCRLQAKIQASLQDDNGFGVFDGELWLCDESDEPTQLLAQAALNVFSPKEAVEQMNG